MGNLIIFITKLHCHSQKIAYFSFAIELGMVDFAQSANLLPVAMETRMECDKYVCHGTCNINNNHNTCIKGG